MWIHHVFHNCCACGLAALFVTHACGQIDIIIARLNDLLHAKYGKGKFNLNARLIKIVEHHLQILRYKNKFIIINIKEFSSLKHEIT